MVRRWTVNYSQPWKQMKTPNRQTVSHLEELPNIGKAMADDLRMVGIKHPQDR